MEPTPVSDRRAFALARCALAEITRTGHINPRAVFTREDESLAIATLRHEPPEAAGAMAAVARLAVLFGADEVCLVEQTEADQDDPAQRPCVVLSRCLPDGVAVTVVPYALGDHGEVVVADRGGDELAALRFAAASSPALAWMGEVCEAVAMAAEHDPRPTAVTKETVAMALADYERLVDHVLAR
ncbi:MAG: hypothetical protein M0010_18600 [Actinomycetota bacterium]|jgi:hypothetical protein|nr:hypothetical protein [Actinomycetota bacterium]